MPCPAPWLPGATFTYGAHEVTAEAIIRFARALDPQPMHLDAASAQAGMMGGLISSGWQTVALHHAMARAALLDGAGYHYLVQVENLRWSTPVRPGDTLRGWAEVLAGDADEILLRHALINQNDETVMGLEARYARTRPTGNDPVGGPYPVGDRPVHPVPFEGIVPGTVTFAGEHRFSRDAALEQRALYDPLRPGEAETVSPWHLAAQWLRMNVDCWNALEAQGITLPNRGPGLGLKQVIWPTPAKIDEPLRYFSRTLEARASSSRPGWGIITNRNYALNAAGEVVVAFTSSALLEGRGA
ncbi:MAG: hypothetical protein LCH39_09225 [Proteobacteria bacterium]|nr:hypothetical protein [Pseudomonadota bacterium]